MRIMVNGEVRQVATPTLDSLLLELGYADTVVATAVNEAFVPVGRRPFQTLNDGDRIEILAPMQGG